MNRVYWSKRLERAWERANHFLWVISAVDRIDAQCGYNGIKLYSE